MGPPKASTKGGSRWRPTAEQVMVLEGLFKGGVTTPTAQQIQKITSQLREYGKVESKNVFYWFQNHKAREKQKLRRKMMNGNQLPHIMQSSNNHNNLLLYYFYLPSQFPSALCPIFPAHPQGVRDIQWRSMENQQEMNSTKEEAALKEDIGSSMVSVTWLATESDSTHNNNHMSHRHERLKTLELFPTSPTTATTTTTTTTTGSGSSTSS